MVYMHKDHRINILYVFEYIYTKRHSLQNVYGGFMELVGNFKGNNHSFYSIVL